MANGTSRISTPAMVVAILVLVAFGGLLAYLFSISSAASETLWNRSIFLYGGVEALAFAAAGFLFGKEVHRAQAENAEQRAEEKTREAERQATKAATAEANGRSLAKVIEAKANPPAAATSRYASIGKVDPTVELLMRSDLAELHQVARQLFP